jgi:hypothetical protein
MDGILHQKERRFAVASKLPSLLMFISAMNGPALPLVIACSNIRFKKP